MMAAKRENEYRDGATGRYSYFGGFDRLCVCGHTLGIHCAGGFDCFAGSNCNIPDDPGGLRCDCQKFRLSRKKPK